MEQDNERGSYHADDTLWDKIWRNDEGDIVIFQWPNIWLIGWAAFNLVSILSPTRNLSRITWWIGLVLIVIWAGLEVRNSANYFRRGLGVVVLLFCIASIFGLGT